MNPQENKIETTNPSKGFLNLNLTKFLMYEEKIAGLEISEFKIRIILLKENNKKLMIQICEEEELPEGTIFEGKLNKPEELVKALKKLSHKTNLKTLKVNSVIASLPSQIFFIQTLQFPRTLNQQQIEEAIRLNANFSLPYPQDTIYFDFEDITKEDSFQKEIFLMVAAKANIDPYIESLEKAEISVIAIESHALSLMRTTKFQENCLVCVISLEGICSFLLRQKTLRFNRFLTWKNHYLYQNESIKKDSEQKIPADELFNLILIDEIERMINFYNIKEKNYPLQALYFIAPSGFIDKSINKIQEKFQLNIETTELLENLPSLPILKEDNFSLIANGAALRGLIPRNEDTINSIMPIGTEQAYEERKETSFVKFLGNLILILNIFFVIIFSGSFIVFSIISNNFEKQTSKLITSENIVKLQSEAVKFNKQMTNFASIGNDIAYWSIIIEKIKNLTIPGVNLSQFNFTKPNEPINIAGNAKNRESLLKFKSIIEKLEIFSEVKIPLTYLEQKENIDFSIELKLKDPNIIIGIK